MPSLADLLPSSTWEKLGVNPYFTNHYWTHAEETYNKLKTRKEEDFCSDDASYAIKVLERYYKAIIQLAHENDDHYRMPYIKNENSDKKGKYLVEYTHGLSVLRKEIVKNFPECFPMLSRSDEDILSKNLNRFQRLYVDASYNEFVSYSTFKEILEFIEKERAMMEDFLNSKPFSKDKDKESEYI